MKLKQYIKKLLKWNIICVIAFFTIVLIIYLSFASVSKDQGENPTLEGFVKYRTITRKITTFLDDPSISLIGSIIIDSESINHEGDLYYSRNVETEITFSDHVNVIVTRANGEVEIIQ